jgi:hypothetical protein
LDLASRRTIDAMASARESEQLIELRIALEDALRRARAGGRFHRVAATVALDSVVERASAFVAVTRGLTVPSNGKLEDLMSRLVEDFAGVWAPSTLPDIRHLRRARNAAQHEGLSPDREQLPVWASAADSYVNSLIWAQFTLDLRRVTLSSAIRGGESRESFARAEEALASGELITATESARQALDIATARWALLHGRRHTAIRRSQGMPTSAEEGIDRWLDSLDARMRDLPFATDAAEAMFVQRAMRADPVLLNQDDVERILAFVFGWITSFEVVEPGWVPDRRHRLAVQLRLERSGEVAASVDSVTHINETERDNEIAFRLRNVPPETEYDEWAATVRDLLAESKTGYWMVQDDGTAIVRTPSIETDTAIAAVEALEGALGNAQGVMRTRRQTIADEALAEETKRQSRLAEVALVRHKFPEWVVDITPTDRKYARMMGEGWYLKVIPEIDRARLRELVIADSRISMFYGGNASDSLVLTTEITLTEVLQVLGLVDDKMCAELDARAALTAGRVERQNATMNAIEHLLAELRDA